MDGRNKYLLLDSGNFPLAYGYLIGDPGGEVLRVMVIDDKVSVIMEHQLIQLVSTSPGSPDFVGRILRNAGDNIFVQKQKSLGEDVRENLRVPVSFDTFIYSLDGEWSGRRRIVTNDLSCRGISFFCGEPLEKGEHMEIVIPVTSQPLILCCEILRQRQSVKKEPLYAAKFINMCTDEETIVREAVFSIQLEQSGR